MFRLRPGFLPIYIAVTLTASIATVLLTYTRGLILFTLAFIIGTAVLAYQTMMLGYVVFA